MAEKKIVLEDLKKELPYKWRVQSYSQYNLTGMCVAYIDSRNAQDRLDEVVGAENWQCEYYEVKENLYCRVGIKINGEWVWKSDCGTESNTEQQKGEASDAFKRACVKWGLGRFLYSLKIQKIDSDKKKAKGVFPNPVDENGKKIWDITAHLNKRMKGTPKKSIPVKKAIPAKPAPKVKRTEDESKVMIVLQQALDSAKTKAEVTAIFREQSPALMKDKEFIDMCKKRNQKLG